MIDILHELIAKLIEDRIFDSSVIKMAFEVTKNTVIGDILDHDETTSEYFLAMGMHCLFCPASRGETLEEACMVHGVDADKLADQLNKHINGN